MAVVEINWDNARKMLGMLGWVSIYLTNDRLFLIMGIERII